MESITEINIKEITLSGFRNRKEPAAFSFGDITCVTGHNGAGKTTLAHAIAFAFYGVTYFGEQKTDRLPFQGHAQAAKPSSFLTAIQ